MEKSQWTLQCYCGVYASINWLFTSVSAVSSTHLEGQTHTHRARSAILPQTDHIRPQVSPQQRHLAQGSQTRYVMNTENVTFAHTQSILGIWPDFGQATWYLWNAGQMCLFFFQVTSLSMRTWNCDWETLVWLPNWRQSNRGKSELLTFFLIIMIIKSLIIKLSNMATISQIGGKNSQLKSDKWLQEQFTTINPNFLLILHITLWGVSISWILHKSFSRLSQCTLTQKPLRQLLSTFPSTPSPIST